MSNPITTASNPRVGEDWVLVPREPTPAMVAATWNDPIDTKGGIESQNARNKRIYRAMIASAPSPEAGAGGEMGAWIEDRLACAQGYINLCADNGTDNPYQKGRVSLLRELQVLLASKGSEEETKGACIKQEVNRWKEACSKYSTENDQLYEKVQHLERRLRASAAALSKLAQTEIDEDAFAEGEHAAIMGQSQFSNPYDPNDEPREHDGWEAGWESGQDDEDGEAGTPEATPQSSPSQTPVDPQMTVEEASEVLDRVSAISSPSQHAKRLRDVASKVNGTRARGLLARASRIEAALRTLQAAGEVR